MTWVDSILRRLCVAARPSRKSPLAPVFTRLSRRLRLEELELREVPATLTEFGLSPGSGPYGITAGPDGALWFTETVSNKIGRITTAGTVTEFSIPTSNSSPQSITTGPDGAFWFTEYASNKIGRVTTSGTFTEFSLAGGSHPLGITTGPDGNIWFTENGTNKVASIVPSGLFAGTITEYALAGGSSPWGITAGPDGNVWFTENGTDKVANIVPSGFNAGTITEYSLSSGAGPRGMTNGPDGNIWFVEEAGTNIGRVTVGGSVTEFATPNGDHPSEIVSGPGGNLYFTPFYTDEIGVISTTGVFSSYAIPTSISRTIGITLGPDNNIWFAEANASQIGQLSIGPVATNDSFTAVQGTPLVKGAVAGVLANDTGTGTLTALVVSNPTHGTLTLNADGSFTYTPTAGYHGPDSFTYKANDGSNDSNTATVTLTVDAPPVAVTDTYTVAVNAALVKVAAQGVLANDTDADGDPLTASVVANPTHGTLTLNADGSFVYTPTAGYAGPDSFTYNATDGTASSNTVTVTITVNAPPVAVADSYATSPNTPLVRNAAQGVLANDMDANGDPLTASVVANPAHGTLTLNADGSFVYTPTAGYHGPDSFTYKANDGTADGNVVTVTLIVGTVPVAVADAYTTGRNTPLVRNAAQGVLANDTDADGDPLAAVLVANPAHGTLTLNADGSFVYTPAANYSGSDSFTYQANDGSASGNTVTVTITVNAPPVAVADAYTVVENTTATKGAVQGVLANDTDADGGPLTAVLVTGPAHGTLTLNADGSFTYTPNRGFAGADRFTYQANDGAADGNTVTVAIAVEAPPVAVNDVNGDGRADIIVGTANASSHIKVFSGTDGSLVRSFFAFDGYQGGVASAGGDTNDDGRTDVIAGSATTGSHVKVFDGATGALVRSFLAFQGYNGGVVVASGDVNGDGFADVIVGTRTGGSHVKVFSGADGSELRSFRAFDGYAGGVSVAGGDVDGDGFADLIVGAATGGSHVKVFSGRDGSELRSYMAFPGYLGGVVVAAGDLNGDGLADVVIGAATGSAHVKAFSGRDGSELRSFRALPGFTGNLAVAVADANGDGVPDIIAGSRTGTSRVTSVNGTSLSPEDSFLAFDNFLGGVAVS